jgi:hypothetical protein
MQLNFTKLIIVNSAQYIISEEQLDTIFFELTYY